VLQFHHHASAAEEAFPALMIAGEVLVQHLDRDAPLSGSVEGLPHHSKATSPDRPDQEVATVAQRIPGAELSSFAQLPAQLENLAIDLVGRDPSVAQDLPALPSSLELLADGLDLLVDIRGRWR
jgi:hypothetical protein